MNQIWKIFDSLGFGGLDFLGFGARRAPLVHQEATEESLYQVGSEPYIIRDFFNDVGAISYIRFLMNLIFFNLCDKILFFI